MERAELIERLNDLIKLDVNAVEAYGQAIKHIKYDDIRRKLLDFQDDHKNHVTSLAAVVREFGGEPAKPSPDFKGYLLGGFTALKSITSTKGALDAMETNEKLTNKKYQEAADFNLPSHVLNIVRSNLAQEERHLSYIQDILTNTRHPL
ncbi:ferritin-like domain-containing protein [Geotalea toluenoxydans]|uniref:ferritin-like domain-containing protein n=1 Tax=Geotalea toluenoxydans TaxID=421624 RepID=UPI0006D12C2C|nr:ferritin-like domain-containing protein [Geotalea toluenoxydans]